MYTNAFKSFTILHTTRFIPFFLGLTSLGHFSVQFAVPEVIRTIRNYRQ